MLVSSTKLLKIESNLFGLKHIKFFQASGWPWAEWDTYVHYHRLYGELQTSRRILWQMHLLSFWNVE